MAVDFVVFSDTTHPDYSKPYGLYCLSSYLRTQGYTVQPISLWFIPDSDFIQLIDCYCNEETLAVGISASTMLNFESSSNNGDNLNFFGLSDEQVIFRLEYIKNKFPKIKIILGGGQITNFLVPSYIKNIVPYIDYICKGEGESVVENILSHLKHGTELKRDILLSESCKTSVITDKLYPNVCFSDTILKIDDQDKFDQGEAFGIEFSRGCIFNCPFCSYLKIGKRAGEYSKDSKILKEQFLYNYNKLGITNYLFLDHTLNDTPESIDLLTDTILSLPFKLSWSAFGRLDLFWKYPDMAKKMYSAGLKSIAFGIETINDPSARIMKKGLGKTRIEESLDICHKQFNGEVLVSANFVLGFPYDNTETTHQLNNWLSSSKIKKVLHQPTIQPLIVDLEMDINRNPEKYGYTITKVPNKLSSWTNAVGYTSEQAFADTLQLRKSLPNTNLTNHFNYPHYLSLGLSESELFYTNSTGNGFRVLKDRAVQLSSDKRSRYLEKLLNFK